MSSTTAVVSESGVFQDDGDTQQAVFEYTFQGTPSIEEVNGGALVTLDGESTWISTGDAVVPVRSSTILLPPGTSIVSVSATYLDEGVTLGQSSVSLLTAPAAVSSDTSLDELDDWSTWTDVLSTSLTVENAVQYVNETLAGYSLGVLSVFPVEYDAASGTLVYHSQVSVTITTSDAGSTDTASLRDLENDAARVTALVDNVAELVAYEALATAPTTTSTVVSATTSPAAALGQADYVVITSEALAPAFGSLIAEKISRGLTAMLVTTEYIYANYTGTENHDNADKIRDYIADAYAYQGTIWVLLGGDTEVVPARGVYGQVGSVVETNIACDLYYAALDGTWDGDGDGIWGEATDGAGGGDVDLAAEVYIGRAPVSTLTEASNFVAKTVQYDTTAQSNTTTIVLLGEELDSQTQGSSSGEIIEEESVPADYEVIELYDTSTTEWTTEELLDVLNGNPNLVEHLGHSSDACNARLTISDVASLTNSDPYFMYSQGCDAGSFDTEDVCIGEQQVVSECGAVAVVMNSRYGWYVPGDNPGGSHNFAASFWDGALSQGILHLGEATQYSKESNLFRVKSTGMDRWIYMESNLLGDPETSLQVGSNTPDGTHGQVEGTVFSDADGDGVQDSGEAGVADQTVYLDSNANGQLDEGTVTSVSSSAGSLAIPDNGTLSATITVSGVATIADLNLTLNIAHSFDSDLEAYLVSPSGTKILLFSHVGDWGQNFTNLTLDDEAGASIDAAAAPFTGTFQAQGRLSLVDGEDPNGTWTLVISDTSVCDAGTLTGWSLTFTSTETSTQTDADGNYSFRGLADGHYQVRLAGSADSAASGPTELVREATIAAGAAMKDVDFALTDDVSPPATDLGAVDYLELTNLALGGDPSWYSVSATHSGVLTIQTTMLESSASVRLLLFDGAQSALGVLEADNSTDRLDLQVEAGEVYHFSLTGSGSADLRLVNLLQQDGKIVTIDGTAGDDHFEVTVGSSYQVDINGVAYSFALADVSAIRFDGGAGNDTATLTGTTGDETATLDPGSATLAGAGYQINVENSECIVVSGGGGNDTAFLYDSAGDDTFTADPTFGQLSGLGYDNRVNGFAAVHAYATAGGNDTAHLDDSAGDDTFLATAQYGRLYGDGFVLRAKFFDAVYAHATAGGYDAATFYDSIGNDAFYATPLDARLSGEGFLNRAQSFDAVYAISLVGDDTAQLFDSAGNDLFVASPTEAELSGDGFKTHLIGFHSVQAYATAGGYDTAQLYDSSGNDVFVATAQHGRLSGSGYVLRTEYFDAVHAYATAGGDDTAYLYGSSGDDVFLGTPTYSRMIGLGYLTRAKLFETVYGYGGGGNDMATLRDSAGSDRLDASDNWLKMSYAEAVVVASDFGSARASAYAGGNDAKHLEAINFLMEMLGVWTDV